MARNFRSRFVVLGTALVLWQAIIAPMTHASTAHAAAQPTMPASAASPSRQLPLQVTKAEAMPCHELEHADVAPGSSVDSHHGVAADVAEADSTTAHPVDGIDCCESLGCQCACVHASMNSVTIAIPALLVPGHPAVLGGDLPLLGARIVELFKPPI